MTEVTGSLFVSCLLCGQTCRTLGVHLSRIHGLSTREYELLHPAAETSSGGYRQRCRDSAKRARARAKARGVHLPQPPGRSGGAQRPRQHPFTKSDRRNLATWQRIKPLVEDGRTHADIASALNQEGILTHRGILGRWTSASVGRVVSHVRKLKDGGLLGREV